MNKSKMVQVLYCLLTIGFFISCASTKQQLMQSKTDYDQVFKACLQATADVNYGISSSDSKAGLIVAEQALMGNSAKVVKLNIIVNRVGDVTEVSISWVPPPGSMGGEAVLDKYIVALKKRIPDIQVAVRN